MGKNLSSLTENAKSFLYEFSIYVCFSFHLNGITFFLLLHPSGEMKEETFHDRYAIKSYSQRKKKRKNLKFNIFDRRNIFFLQVIYKANCSRGKSLA
jgi:hypothetical protein